MAALDAQQNFMPYRKEVKMAVIYLCNKDYYYY